MKTILRIKLKLFSDHSITSVQRWLKLFISTHKTIKTAICIKVKIIKFRNFPQPFQLATVEGDISHRFHFPGLAKDQVLFNSFYSWTASIQTAIIKKIEILRTSLWLISLHFSQFCSALGILYCKIWHGWFLNVPK